jgi:hypothetical protein
MPAAILPREEYIEQVHFFRALRERLETNQAAQDVLEYIQQEVLTTTRLPYAIQFLAAELKHSGILASGFERLSHYFTPFQAFVIRQAEKEGLRFSMQTALLVLEREAKYRAEPPTPAGLFFYQFEVLCRNRLGYDEGLTRMAEDPFFDADWRACLEMVRRQVGSVDFAELIYLRSEQYVLDQRRTDPDYQPPVPALIGEKEGRIAKANRQRDPLWFFAALQRQLNYPEVPRARPADDLAAKLKVLEVKLQQMEARIKLVEGEMKGQVDLSKLGKPEILRDDDE